MFPLVAHVPLTQSTGTLPSAQQPRPADILSDRSRDLCSAVYPYTLTVPVRSWPDQALWPL